MVLSDVSIKRPVFASVLILSLTVIGLFSFSKLGVDQFPKIDFPSVLITTVQPGASPEQVETEVTDKIEEAVNMHAGIAECAVVGVADTLKGQLPMAFAVAKDAEQVATPEGRSRLEGEIMQTVDRQLGAIGRPGRVYFVSLLPKTRSGKVLRRSIQALAEGRDPGDLTTIEDPGALQQIRDCLKTPT